ncbi:Zinc finger, C2H2 type family protein [Reticulomyxa filosa]|uniref:Zinc finger, C2H2 type family protein n=1 Tax=Reticulomyxa filosa TaxID=46433 RepID=X6M767_RETFI|nr:Zinc finger, C2H2 type family protein [Reticulomyxa filosa]|eukprot:ETO09769.1 Zinc finger, C2H2 type family protein [Reticulomyxa filosa]
MEVRSELGFGKVEMPSPNPTNNEYSKHFDEPLLKKQHENNKSDVENVDNIAVSNQESARDHKKDSREWKCNICNAVFTKAVKLKRHLICVHSGFAPLFFFVCLGEKHIFDDKAKKKKKSIPFFLFSLPLSLSSPPHPFFFLWYCTYPDCKNTYKRADHLKRHILTHTKEKKFECHFMGCRQSFFLKHHLKSHINYVHLHLHWNTCKECGLRFARKRDLAKHTLECHAEKCTTITHPCCHICHKLFSCQRLLARHLKRHFSERKKTERTTKRRKPQRQLQCNFCQHKFVVLHDHLKKERKLQHIAAFQKRFASEFTDRPELLKRFTKALHYQEIDGKPSFSVNVKISKKETDVLGPFESIDVAYEKCRFYVDPVLEKGKKKQLPPIFIVIHMKYILNRNKKKTFQSFQQKKKKNKKKSNAFFDNQISMM